MDSDDRFVARILKRDDDLRHAGKLVAACNAVDALLISAAWRGKTETMMRVPVAEIPQSPVRRKGFTELPQVIDIEAKVRVIALRVWSCLRCKENGGDVSPSPEKIASGLDGPS